MHELIELVRDAIGSQFGQQFKVDSFFKEKYNSQNGVFVTLKIDGKLRGCIGFTESQLPLYQSIIEAAQNAAFDDPRFPPLSKEEFENISVEVSILSDKRELKSRNPLMIKKEIEIGKHGLIFQKSFKSGLLLPQVATEQGWDVDEFLKNVCIKAGFPPNTWKEEDSYELYTFEARIISEED